MRKKLIVKSDQRGHLVEIFKEELSQGQVYMFSCKPGQTRGNHYHKRKTESFCVIEGEAVITLKPLKGKSQRIKVSGTNIEKVFIPVNVIHSVENKGGKDVIVLAYISEKYDEKDPDTYYV